MLTDSADEAGSLRVLLVEPWFAGSHRAWAEGYAAHSRHQVEIVGLPGELWRWRLHGGAASLAPAIIDHVGRHGTPDVLLVSSLLDVSQLLGLTRRCVAPEMPVVAYQHESQLVYPSPKDDRSVLMANWQSWLAADLVLFNSQFHLDAVREALPGFVDRLPDGTHRSLLAEVLDRFEVCSLGVDLAWLSDTKVRVSKLDRPLVVWPHRWNADKAPDVFARAVDRLVAAEVPVGLVLAGEGGDAEEVRRTLVGRHPDLIVAAGPFSRDRYRHWLRQADIVVSCAEHEFFGVGVVEAVAAGCVPVVPDRLAYPEVLGPGGYPAGRFGSALEAAVRGWKPGQQASPGTQAMARSHRWSLAVPQLDAALTESVGLVTGR